MTALPPPPFRLLERLYADTPMRRIWSEDECVSTWLRVEAELARAQAAVGLLDAAEAEAIAAACRDEAVGREALWDAGRVVGYPILGLVRQVAATLPDGPNGRVHFGATTQDIMDTALSVQLAAACDRLVDLAHEVGDGLAVLVGDHRGTVMAARTHGQQAVPTTFGAKAAVYLDQVADGVERIRRCRAEVAVVSLFGAGGTNAAMGPRSREVRAGLAAALQLRTTDVPWHAARQGVVAFGLACSMLAGVCARLAREVVDLSRNEIGEVTEQGGHLRGASSTMPQKTNPISSESILGFALAAQVEGAGLLRALESEHERSAGEWQLEWLLVPQVAEHTAAALALSADLSRTLVVRPERMARNLHVDSALIMSEALMMGLARRVGRERAHDLVYEAAAAARSDGGDLPGAARRLLAAQGLDGLLEDIASPGDYLGETSSVCDAALERWAALTASAAPTARGGRK
jgi:3-carboxy-cis,cis-muconate cycloisomerase